MRRFAFEADIYKTLSCVPMSVRRNWIARRLKIGLEQWLSFDRGPTTTLFLSTRYRTTHWRIRRHMRMFVKKHGSAGHCPEQSGAELTDKRSRRK
jgi:hypothetical protein